MEISNQKLEGFHTVLGSKTKLQSFRKLFPTISNSFIESLYVLSLRTQNCHFELMAYAFAVYYLEKKDLSFKQVKFYK